MLSDSPPVALCDFCHEHKAQNPCGNPALPPFACGRCSTYPPYQAEYQQRIDRWQAEHWLKLVEDVRAERERGVSAGHDISAPSKQRRASTRAYYYADDVERAVYELRAAGEDDRLPDIDRYLRALPLTKKANGKNVSNALKRAIPPRRITDIRRQVDDRLRRERAG